MKLSKKTQQRITKARRDRAAKAAAAAERKNRLRKRLAVLGL
jgi:hypothetical protein